MEHVRIMSVEIQSGFKQISYSIHDLHFKGLYTQRYANILPKLSKKDVMVSKIWKYNDGMCPQTIEIPRVKQGLLRCYLSNYRGGPLLYTVSPDQNLFYQFWTFRKTRLIGRIKVHLRIHFSYRS